MANNLMNDLFDLEVGTDREDYPRNLYSPHPVLSGVITRRGLAASALVVNVCCLAIMIVLTVARGPIVAFALGGFLLSPAYTAPPLRWLEGAGRGGSDGGGNIGRKAKNTAIAPRPRAVMHVASAQARTVRRPTAA